MSKKEEAKKEEPKEEKKADKNKDKKKGPKKKEVLFQPKTMAEIDAAYPMPNFFGGDIDVSKVDRIEEKEVKDFKAKYIYMTKLSTKTDEGKKRVESEQHVADLQYARWDWAWNNITTYVNVLRVAGFKDENIQLMLDGLVPFCFKDEKCYNQFRVHLEELRDDLEKDKQTPWTRIRFIQTGSSNVGFSTNPLKGKADRPTRITDPKKSDVDIVIVADGIAKWCEDCRKKKLGYPSRDFTTTTSRNTFGVRVGLPHDQEVTVISKPLGKFQTNLQKSLGVGVQFTFQKSADPTIPPWESWISSNPSKKK